MLKDLFNRYDVHQWGIASLDTVIEGSAGYKCIAFGLPFDSAAITTLPDDKLIDRCKDELNAKTKAIYAAIQEELCQYSFESYDDIDRKLNLSEKKVSQKVLGYLAGLGWIGKSSLLISPVFGPRMRLGTIFTKNKLGATDSPYIGSCGDCIICSEICPSGSICEEGYNVEKCRQVVRDDKGNYKTFCGLCMKMCPQGTANKAMHSDALISRR